MRSGEGAWIVDDGVDHGGARPSGDRSSSLIGTVGTVEVDGRADYLLLESRDRAQAWRTLRAASTSPAHTLRPPIFAARRILTAREPGALTESKNSFETSHQQHAC